MKVLLFILGFAISKLSFAQSEIQSTLELGLGYGTGAVPDYPASDQYQVRSLFIPVIVYRGNVLKSDQEEGTRAELFKSTDYKINLSFGARFSADSSANRARQGMPNLDYVLEAGPNIRYRAWSNLEQTNNLILQIPLRFAINTDFKKSNYLGIVFEPEIRYEKNNFLFDNFKSSSSVSFEFLTNRVANYYYEVEPEYQNSQRSVYQAKTGFAGVDYTQSFIYQANSWLVIFGASYADYSQSVNKESPLYKQSYNSTYFVAVGWFFYNKK